MTDIESQTREQVDGVPRLLVLVKARNVLDAFTASAPELTISELVARTGMPTSTCVRIVRNLAHDGLLERTGDKYRIGLAIVRWAGLALTGRSLVELASPTVEWLRDRTGESVQLCVRDGHFAVVVAAANSHHSVRRQISVGEVSYLHAGSMGKIFLAFDPSALDALDSVPLESFTPNTITDRSKLLETVEHIRTRGFASSIGERNSGAAGVTAPVLATDGTLLAAIGITGPVSRIDASSLEDHTQSVLEAAQRISEHVGRRLA